MSEMISDVSKIFFDQHVQRQWMNQKCPQPHNQSLKMCVNYSGNENIC